MLDSGVGNAVLCVAELAVVVAFVASCCWPAGMDLAPLVVAG